MPIEDGGPAFPAADENFGATVHSQTGRASPGMTLRQYAAIKLKVPNSGTKWLDEMIEQSSRGSHEDAHSLQ